jgi:hypothetical protein
MKEADSRLVFLCVPVLCSLNIASRGLDLGKLLIREGRGTVYLFVAGSCHRDGQLLVVFAPERRARPYLRSTCEW